MKLATLANGSGSQRLKDGHLAIVDLKIGSAAVVDDPYPSLMLALEDWEQAEPFLKRIQQEHRAGRWKQVVPIEKCVFAAPLPRTYQWLDGSAFLEHVKLVRRARGAPLPEQLEEVPLMYQGVSDSHRSPSEPIPYPGEDFGVDFEGEFGVVLSGTPEGPSSDAALRSIALLVLMNDISFRNLIPEEVKTGFGFLQSKPATAFAPFAVTPDELGDAWREARVHLPLEVHLNGEKFGSPSGSEMHFSFVQLIQHAARTRSLSPGTIIGSGTVSNEDESVGSCCIAERRMREILSEGDARTPFLVPGDRVELESFASGESVFGKIDQLVESLAE